MSNSNGTGGGQLHVARLPFGEESALVGGVNRLAGILAGADELVAQAVVKMVTFGGGISFAGTADGGALSVTVFFGRDRQKKYAASPEGLQALLDAVIGWEPAKPVELRPRPAVVGDRRH
jgi:hypothetical protein